MFVAEMGVFLERSWRKQRSNRCTYRSPTVFNIQGREHIVFTSGIVPSFACFSQSHASPCVVVHKAMRNFDSFLWEIKHSIPLQHIFRALPWPIKTHGPTLRILVVFWYVCRVVLCIWTGVPWVYSFYAVVFFGQLFLFVLICRDIELRWNQNFLRSHLHH